MGVTDLDYYMEPYLLSKLDTMIVRCTQKTPKRDALFINEGAEGEGKTNSSAAEGYYIKFKTGRPIHLFFRLNDVIDFAKTTEDKIIIWDEPSLEFLNTEYYKEINLNFIRLLMTCRKKRHFIIVNMTKFFKFSEYIVVDRALGMVHMYSKDDIEPGHFVYIRKRALETLYTQYRRTKKRLYRQLASAHGTFGEVMEHHFDKMGITVNGIPNATLAQYNIEKDKAIIGIGSLTKTEAQYIRKLNELRFKVATLLDKRQVAQTLGLHIDTLYKWARKDLSEAENGGVSEFRGRNSPKNVITRDEEPDGFES